ncbi:glycoside hydrolase family 3 N-terminal domain-containing protein [Sulfurospirillum arcachonense]|uniref:glycoside hydrolase family 3 N-terminal domain-containing protein n=1 Tax=Sulfurospirillum arcachonense TaxID=57666 RepID=UPI0004694BC0|nr:glycoside hydrolase family 3 N-terminal domain-containing protein [Sulfurospirillum arcachonense]
MKYIVILFLLISSVYSKTPSLEYMISQMIMVGVGGSKPSEKWVKQLKRDIENEKIGGVILFGNNIENPKQLLKLTTYLSSVKTKNPLFIAIDQEGGKVQRLSEKNSFHSYDAAFELARNKTLTQTYETYEKMANELKEYGFNVNFGPVVDLNINPNSPAIGAKKRAYSDQEEIVVAYATEFINAHKSRGIITVLKHFPGHGSAKKDSHKDLTDVSTTWQYKELKPYYDLIKYDRVDAIMVGHISLDKFDKIYPASLSKNTIKGLLRNKLEFQGVVFSDDMRMKAISDRYTLKESVKLAINADVDVLVFSSYFTKKSSVIKEVTDIILEAVKKGEIKKEEIIDSYERVVKLKGKYDIN